jgi:hypothetical protein
VQRLIIPIQRFTPVFNFVQSCEEEYDSEHGEVSDDDVSDGGAVVVSSGDEAAVVESGDEVAVVVSDDEDAAVGIASGDDVIVIDGDAGELDELSD